MDPEIKAELSKLTRATATLVIAIVIATSIFLDDTAIIARVAALGALAALMEAYRGRR